MAAWSDHEVQTFNVSGEMMVWQGDQRAFTQRTCEASTSLKALTFGQTLFYLYQVLLRKARNCALRELALEAV